MGHDGRVSEPHSPIDGLLDRLVYAPLGLVIDARTVVPQLASARPHAGGERQGDGPRPRCRWARRRRPTAWAASREPAGRPGGVRLPATRGRRRRRADSRRDRSGEAAAASTSASSREPRLPGPSVRPRPASAKPAKTARPAGDAKGADGREADGGPVGRRARDPRLRQPGGLPGGDLSWRACARPS